MLRTTFVSIALVGIVGLFGANAFSAELLSTDEMVAIQGAANTCSEPHVCDGTGSCTGEMFLWYRCTPTTGQDCWEHYVYVGCLVGAGNKLMCSASWRCEAYGE